MLTTAGVTCLRSGASARLNAAILSRVLMSQSSRHAANRAFFLRDSEAAGPKAGLRPNARLRQFAVPTQLEADVDIRSAPKQPCCEPQPARRPPARPKR